MHPTGRCFVYLLLLNSCGFFILRDDFVSAGIIEDASNWVKSKNPFENFLNFVKPIEDESIRAKTSIANGAGTWLAKSIKTAISVTTKFCKSKKPMTFFTALDETCLVNQTCNSLDVTILNPISVATMTGGILGHDLFELYKYSFAWRKNSCNSTLECQVIYRNLKYGSFEKAMDHSDGIALVNFPIAINGDFDNPKFVPFSKFLQWKIKGPGSWATITSKFTYTWFVNFPPGSIYQTYTIPYFDENCGKTTKAVVIEPPLDQRVNFISKQQFEDGFGKMGTSSGHISSEKGALSPIERHKGIAVFYLPA